jgi:4-amino-4-deoxy-L-arabinose transferase-like glycosyltransferase
MSDAAPAKPKLRPRVWGAGAFALGALLALLAMVGKPPQLEWRFLEMLLGSSGVLLASAALVYLTRPAAPTDAAATSTSEATSPSEAIALLVSARALLPGVAQLLLSGLALRFVINRAIVGSVPAPLFTLAVAVPALCLSMLWGALRFAEPFRSRADGNGDAELSVWQRAWPTALTLLVYLPTLGSFALIDCWESQYSEVAREMLARHDWISLWWGDQSWFFSKPILDFWLQGLSYAWFGLDPAPEAMLQGIASGRTPLPEWAARLPIAACAIAGQVVLQAGTARYFGRRAAALGSVILATCPYWLILARQTMVDMTYAGPLSAALGFLALAGATDPECSAPRWRIQLRSKALTLSGGELLWLCLCALSLAQIFYLLSRHLSLQLGDAAFLHVHLDQVWLGSPGNCTLPGNAPCMVDVAATRTALQPGYSALLWASCLGLLLGWERREQRLRGLYQLAAWLCVALAAMGKGAPGLVLPLCIWGAWLLLQGRLGELRRAKLPSLLLILLAVAAPWFVQAYARHGEPFLARLFLQDMVQRAFGHVHDTNAGVDTSFRYYLWQLGYGLFPWTGVIAAGALFCMSRSSQPGVDARFRAGTQLFACWLLAGFGLFSIAGTKFHHYALPLVPAAAVLGGVWLDELWQRRGASPALARGAALGLGAAAVTALVASDLARPGDMPGAAALLQLVTYLYTRPWPAALDYRLEISVVAALMCALCLLAFVPRAWRALVLGSSALGVCFAVWLVHVYLPQLAPHWGQRENISTYYRARSGPEELLVAYRQNWMGENFYTSNHVATFKSAGAPFRDWIQKQRDEGKHVLFFTTEHQTVSQLQRDLGQKTKLEPLTTREQNNKFVLLRAQL